MRTTEDLIIEPRHARHLVITRTFSASKQLVFDAWTQPELLRQWFGPLGWRLTTCDIDLRAGGRFLFILQRPNRTDMTLRGTYEAVEAPTRLATSERWHHDWTEGETRTTTMFDEHDSATTVTRTIEFTSAAARDRALGSIGRGGLEDAFKRLDGLVGVEPDRNARHGAGRNGARRSEGGRDNRADRYRRRAARFEELILGVGSDVWASQSPCQDWTARDVVDHVVDMHAAMLAPLGRSLDPEASTGPLVAFTAARARLQQALDDRTLAESACETPAGTLTFAEHVDAALSVDLVVHGWDLARATGQDDTIPAEDLTLLWPIAEAIPEQFRLPGALRPGLVVFGPRIPVAADAPLQHKVLGLYGRDAGWQS